jgi:hypothetical protein
VFFDADLWDFTTVASPGWRLVAKELVMAMVTPRHPVVAPLPRAYRTALHLWTCAGRLAELSRFLRWLDARGVTCRWPPRRKRMRNSATSASRPSPGSPLSTRKSSNSGPQPPERHP